MLSFGMGFYFILIYLVEKTIYFILNDMYKFSQKESVLKAIQFQWHRQRVQAINIIYGRYIIHWFASELVPYVGTNLYLLSRPDSFRTIRQWQEQPLHFKQKHPISGRFQENQEIINCKSTELDLKGKRMSYPKEAELVGSGERC